MENKERDSKIETIVFEGKIVSKNIKGNRSDIIESGV